MANCNCTRQRNNCYRVVQMTNAAVGAVATGTNIPLGIMTREITQESSCRPTFIITTNTNDAVYLNEPGYYKIHYDGYLTVGAAGDIIVNLVYNGQVIHTATVTAGAAGTYLVSFTYMIRLFNNCASNSMNLPVLIRLSNTGTPLTGGNSNTIIERIDTAK